MRRNNKNFDPKTIAPGINVEVRDGNFDRAIKIFSKKVQESGLLREIREREHFTKPTVKRKQAKAAARKRWLKKKQQSMPEAQASRFDS